MKIALFVFFLFCSLFAKEIDATYKVYYGLFGKIGNSYAHFESNSTHYKIEIKAKATGLAKILSNGRVEEYRSEGVIENGILKPLLYEKVRKSYSKIDKKIYRFFHKKRYITVHREIYKKGKQEAFSDENLSFYAKNDILTLYFNLKHFLKPNQYKYQFHAVGGDRKSGLIEVNILKGKKREEIKRLMESEGLYVSVILHQKIFSSKKGELFLVLDKNGITKKALLKDVILFGDIRGELKDLEIKE